MVMKCVLASIFVSSVLALPPHITRWPRATPEPSTPLTTKVYLWELIDGAKVFHEQYTPMTFQYYNEQFQHGPYPRYDYDRCYDDFIRCTLGHTLPYTVCAFKWLKRGTMSSDGTKDRLFQEGIMFKPMSYCEVYHVNCMMGEKAWRVLDSGWCTGYNEKTINIVPLHHYDKLDKSWYKEPVKDDYRYKPEYRHYWFHGKKEMWDPEGYT